MMKLLILFVCSFISLFGINYVYFKICDKRIKLSLFKIALFIVGVVTEVLLKYNEIAIQSYFVVCPVLFFIYGFTDLKKFIYNVIFVWLFGMILDFTSMLVVSILYYAFHINVENYLVAVLMSLYVCGMFILLSNVLPIKKWSNSLYNKVFKIKYSDFILILFMLFVFIVSLILIFNIRNITIGIMSCVVLALTIISLALILKTKFSEIENKIFLETLKANNDFYITVDEEQKILKHNLMSKFLSIKSVSNNKARVLIDDIISDFNISIDYARNIKDIPYGLNGIVNQKVYPYSEEIDIKVTNNIKVDIFTVLKPRRYNVLVEKLSILLDNAIEATLKSVDKILVINIFEEDKEIIIEVKNTFSGNIDVDNLGEIHYSTKGDKRGLGIYSALRNKEVSLDLKLINNMFSAKLTTKKNK